MFTRLAFVIDTVRVFLPKCPLTTIRSRFSADELQIVRGEATLLMVLRGQFGRKNEYRFLTYTIITGNSFDRKMPNQPFRYVSMISFGYLN